MFDSELIELSPYKCLSTALFRGSEIIDTRSDKHRRARRKGTKKKKKKGKAERSIPRGISVRDRRKPRYVVSNRSNCRDTHTHTRARSQLAYARGLNENRAKLACTAPKQMARKQKNEISCRESRLPRFANTSRPVDSARAFAPGRQVN